MATINIDNKEGTLLSQYIEEVTQEIEEDDEVTTHRARSLAISELADELYTGKQLIHNALSKSDEIYVFDTPHGPVCISVSLRFKNKEMTDFEQSQIDKRLNYVRNT